MKYALLIYLFFVSLYAYPQNEEKVLQSNETSYSYVESLINFQNQFLLFDYQRAKKFVSKSLEIAEKNNYKNLLPEIYANTGYIFQKEGDADKAQKYYDKSILLSKQNNNRRALAIALRFYGTFYTDRSEYNKGFEKITEAKSIADALNDTLLSALCFQNMGYVYGKKGFFDSAQFYYSKSSEKLENTRFELMKARADLNICLMMLSKGETNKSIISIVKNAIELCSKNNEKRGIAQAYDILAMYYYNIAHYEECLNAYESESYYLSAIGDLQAQCTNLNNLGNVFIQLNKYDSSEVYFNKALQIAYKLDNKDEIADGLSNLGQVLNHKGQYQQAIDNLYQALSVSKKLESLETTHVILLRLGNSYFGMENYNKALELYSEALKVSKEINDIDGQSTNLSKLTDTYEKLGDYKNAFYNFKKYTELNDSLTNVDMYSKLEETEKKYETKIKNDSLKLQAKNLFISNQKVTGRNSLIKIAIGVIFLVSCVLILLFRAYKRTKLAKDKIELLQKELHHRVKNNLAIVARLVEVAARQVENTMPLKELQSRIRSMASLHERLYQQDNVTTVKFNNVIKDIFSQINKSDIIGKAVKDNINTDADIELNADKAIPLGLIVNELITNSYKYAFEKTSDPLVELNISKSNNKLTMHYKDNGKGLPDVSGIDTESYGFKLIKGLSSQLNGSYRFWNDAGFNFELVIPV